MAKFRRFINEYRPFRTFALLWAIGLITYATVRVFSDKPPVIPNGTAMVYGSVIGILSVVFAFYEVKRGKTDDMEKRDVSE